MEAVPKSGRFRRTLAALIAPDIARKAEAHTRLWYALDEARWWLGGGGHQEAASLAQFILDRQYWYWTGEERDNPLPWTPPPWVTTISLYRVWLENGGAGKGDHTSTVGKESSARNEAKPNVPPSTPSQSNTR